MDKNHRADPRQYYAILLLLQSTTSGRPVVSSACASSRQTAIQRKHDTVHVCLYSLSALADPVHVSVSQTVQLLVIRWMGPRLYCRFHSQSATGYASGRYTLQSCGYPVDVGIFYMTAYEVCASQSRLWKGPTPHPGTGLQRARSRNPRLGHEANTGIPCYTS